VWGWEDTSILCRGLVSGGTLDRSLLDRGGHPGFKIKLSGETVNPFLSIVNDTDKTLVDVTQASNRINRSPKPNVNTTVKKLKIYAGLMTVQTSNCSRFC
jgi:hypothetical protein